MDRARHPLQRPRAGAGPYHLKRLIIAESLVDEQRYSQTHNFASAVSDWERGVLSLIHREAAADVVAALYNRGSTSSGTLAKTPLDIARSTLE